VKQRSQRAIHTHCGIHRQVLASRTLPDIFIAVMEDVFRSVNSIRSSALNSRLFQQLCNEMSSEYEHLLYYTQVRWLSRGRVLLRFLLLRHQVAEFLITKKKFDSAAQLSDKHWVLILAYLTDILNLVNELNLSLQGKLTKIIDMTNKIKAFCMKLELWLSKVDQDSFFNVSPDDLICGR